MVLIEGYAEDLEALGELFKERAKDPRDCGFWFSPIGPRYKTFSSEIAALNAELRTIFSGMQGMQFMVFHPAWGYFAHTYGLEQVPVEIQGKHPKPAQLKELIKHAQKNNIKVIFVQPQFSAKSAEVIARGIGGEVVLADPLAENWAPNLRDVARNIKAALR